MTFVHADPHEYLRGLKPGAEGPMFTTAVLVHSVWYHDAPSVLAETLRLLKPHVKRVCIAEYALRATERTAVPHVLATFARAGLECRRDSTANIRTLVSPTRIKAIASEAGWTRLVREDVKPPTPPNLDDGRWEIDMVLKEKFVKEAESKLEDEKVREVVLAMRDAVVASVDAVKSEGLKVTTMDVWTGVFEQT